MINSFWLQLKQFGISRIFLSVDFIIPAAVVILAERATIGVSTYALDYSQILDTLVGMFAFVFAALAILIALSETKFIKAMIEFKKYDGLLFHYWFSCNIFLISIAYILFASITSLHNKYYELVAIFLIAYSLCLTLGLVKTTISAGLYRARLSENDIDNPQTNDLES